MARAVGVELGVAVGLGLAVGVELGVGVGVGVTLAVGVGLGLGVVVVPYGIVSRFCNDLSKSILAVCTVFQSSVSIPPVSPEFGFHDQNVQCIPLPLM